MHKTLYDFVLEGNSDQAYAIICEDHVEDIPLMCLATDYENGKIDDLIFCLEIVQELEKTM